MNKKQIKLLKIIEEKAEELELTNLELIEVLTFIKTYHIQPDKNGIE